MSELSISARPLFAAAYRAARIARRTGTFTVTREEAAFTVPAMRVHDKEFCTREISPRCGDSLLIPRGRFVHAGEEIFGAYERRKDGRLIGRIGQIKNGEYQSLKA